MKQYFFYICMDVRVRVLFLLLLFITMSKATKGGMPFGAAFDENTEEAITQVREFFHRLGAPLRSVR
jgi:hypothetical protein